MQSLYNPKLLKINNQYNILIELSDKIKNLSIECKKLRKDIKFRNEIILNETKIKYNEKYLRDFISISDKLIDRLIELESQRTFYVNYYIEYVNNVLKSINVEDNVDKM